MNISSSPNSSPHDLPSASVAEVNRLLSRRIRDVRLEGELLAHFRRHSWQRRSKQVRAWMYWVIAINFIMMFYYQLLIPQAMWLGIFVSGVVISPICFIVSLVWRKPRSSFVEGLSTTLCGIGCVVAIAILGSVAGGYNQERFATGAVFIICTATILFAVEFVWTISLAAVTAALFTITNALNPLMDAATAISVSTFYLAGLAALAASRRTANILAMHAFLLSLRDRMNATALAKANEQLQVLATKDPLTGIANKRMITDHLMHLWAAPAGPPSVAIVMIDIDHFKAVNDTRGHAEGDRALKQIADSICTCMRPSLDMAARYGGEEFIAVLTEAPPPVLISLAEGIRRKVEALAISNPGAPDRAHVTVSIGVAFARPQETADDTVRRADAALYRAKGAGRNRVVFDIPERQQVAFDPAERAIDAVSARPAAAAG